MEAAAAAADGSAEASCDAPAEAPAAELAAAEGNVVTLNAATGAASERVALLVQQLGADDAVQQRAAAAAIAALCTGERDEPADADACAALLAHGGVGALLRLVCVPDETAALDALDAAKQNRIAALAALAALTDVHAPARAAVADADGLRALAAALAPHEDAEVVEGAARVLFYVSRDDTLEILFLEQGVMHDLIRVISVPSDYCEARSEVGAPADPPHASTGLAAAALSNLCNNDKIKTAVREAGGIAALVAVLQNDGDDTAVEMAASAIRNLCSKNETNQHAVREAGGIAALVTLLHEGTATVVSEAADAIWRVCLENAENQNALRDAGGIAALVALLQLDDADVVEGCLATLWAVAEDSHKNAENLRACDGIPAILKLIQQSGTETECTFSALGVLMTLSNNDSLQAALVEAQTLSVVEPVVRQTTNDETRLVGLLLVACAYSSQSDAAAETLLRLFDVTEHLRNMVQAVLPGKPGSYNGVDWSPREVCNYVRVVSISRDHAERLAVHGVPTLLVQLLAQMKHDTVVQQHICRALLNFAYVPELLPRLRDAGIADAMRACIESASDTVLDTTQAAKGAQAAKGVLLALGELHDAAAEEAADAAEAGAELLSGAAVAGADKPRFRVFLSHKRTDAKDFARGLYNLLVLRGFSAFLDFEYREELNDLAAVVAACDNLIFVLSDNVFESEWCLQELKAAVQNGVNVILVRKEGALWQDEHGRRVRDHPSSALINAQDEAVRATLFSSKAIAHSDEYYAAFCETLISRLASPEAAAKSRARALAAQRAAAGGAADPLSRSGSVPQTPVTPARAFTVTAGHGASAAAVTPAAAAPQLHPGAAAPPPPPPPPPDALLAEVQRALSDVRRELAELRREQAASRAAASSLLVPTWISAAGVTCCVALVAVALQAAACARRS